VAPPAKDTRTWATDEPTEAATHQAGEPSVTPKLPVVIAEIQREPLPAVAGALVPALDVPALAEPALPVLAEPALLPAADTPVLAKAAPSNNVPCPTAAASDRSSVYKV
jgi:hypothetical protein